VKTENNNHNNLSYFLSQQQINHNNLLNRHLLCPRRAHSLLLLQVRRRLEEHFRLLPLQHRQLPRQQDCLRDQGELSLPRFLRLKVKVS